MDAVDAAEVATRYRFTVAAYEQMGQCGILDKESITSRTLPDLTLRIDDLLP
jgi:hypothetical protein